MKKGLITPNAFQRWQAGHPWLTADDIRNRNELPKRPSAVFFGDSWWFCSPESYLRLRRFGPTQHGWMKNPNVGSITSGDKFKFFFGEWLTQHLAETLERKLKLLNSDEDPCLRWVFSESDLLPGLTVDLYKDILVCQITTAPIEAFWWAVRESLVAAFTKNFGVAPKEIIEMRNSKSRAKEGLDVIEPEDSQTPDAILRWNGFRWSFAVHSPKQKTGAYLDQRENHLKAAELAKKLNCKTAWDVCSYQGGFTVHLLAAGLTFVTAVDQSQAALTQLQKNCELNNLNSQDLKIAKADAFDWLKEQVAKGAKADLIILDPPSFAKSREHIENAKKGYLDLNRMALQCLNPGGLLVSCVCSHHMRPQDYRKIIEEAGKSTQRKLEFIEMRGASADHSPLKGFTEGDYLQAWFVQSVS